MPNSRTNAERLINSLTKESLEEEIKSYFEITPKRYLAHAKSVLKAKTGKSSKEARSYFIKVDNELLPMKAVARMAQIRAAISNFNPNSLTFVPALKHFGYEIVHINELANFELGQEYSRQDDIHRIFGGQQQGGISTPAQQPFVFIFTGKSGAEFGYEDGWQDNGVFLYTGEGQVGDMEMSGGNKAILEHAEQGKELLLFEATGKGKPYIFRGKLACQSWDEQEGKDKNGNFRKIIRFHLVSKENTQITKFGSIDYETPEAQSLEKLRDKAINASSVGNKSSWKSAPKEYRKRSKAVKDYVFARANGICELTGKPAPFNRKDGSPYLEAHHTRQISDDGPDHPRWVGAICPTVHREIHFGEKGDELNDKLKKILGELEG